MKIRNGFVSNSSSSSFLVAFPKSDYTPSVDEVIKNLFGDFKDSPSMPKGLRHPYEEHTFYPADVVCSVVSKDMERCKIYPDWYQTTKEMKKNLMHSLETHLLYQIQSRYNDRQEFLGTEFSWMWNELQKLPAEPEREGFIADESEKDRQARYQAEWKKQDAWKKKCMPFVRKIIKRMFKEMGKKYDFYMLHYGDEDGSFYSAMEHGDLFHKVPHIRFSEH